MSFFPCQRVIVPVDFSEDSFDAVEVGLQLVDRPEHLYVVNVGLDAVSGDPGFPWNVTDKLTRRVEITKQLEKRLADAHAEGLHIHVMFGDPGAEIADFAKEIQADLVVMPSHGRTGLKRLLMGSVAERVTRLCHCPVLILRK